MHPDSFLVSRVLWKAGLASLKCHVSQLSSLLSRVNDLLYLYRKTTNFPPYWACPFVALRMIYVTNKNSFVIDSDSLVSRGTPDVHRSPVTFHPLYLIDYWLFRNYYCNTVLKGTSQTVTAIWLMLTAYRRFQTLKPWHLAPNLALRRLLKMLSFSEPTSTCSRKDSFLIHLRQFVSKFLVLMQDIVGAGQVVILFRHPTAWTRKLTSFVHTTSDFWSTYLKNSLIIGNPNTAVAL